MFAHMSLGDSANDILRKKFTDVQNLTWMVLDRIVLWTEGPDKYFS